ncbi:hypothetical protein LV89_04450 [Arcicella aurantiaca]|uniref:Uncharacterized protein n=1 Tax=Arcicella aurantiaca TaxID=591202 RepID=A0A316DGB6_9BACT|nr:hypothetical protein [Arcicella aurantiaca]PWK17164.1 hypothetical protein LV89_04450 [Arcicella aurantiaca]
MKNQTPNPHIQSAQHWLDLEIAIEIIAEMKGIRMSKILREMNKPSPDINKIATWRLELQDLGIERNLLLYDSTQTETVIQKSKTQYSEEIKTYYAAPR